MNKFEKYIQLSASIASLFAFIVLIFEKTPLIGIPIMQLFMYVVITIYTLAVTSLAIFYIQWCYSQIVQINNVFLRTSAVLVFQVLFPLVAYALIVGIPWFAIINTNF